LALKESIIEFDITSFRSNRIRIKNHKDFQRKTARLKLIKRAVLLFNKRLI